MPAELEVLAGSWLLTYTLHSTLLLGLAWLLTRRLVETPARREQLWKAALVGGLVTTTLQTALPFEPVSGVMSLARRAGVASVPRLPAAGTPVQAWTGIRPDAIAGRATAPAGPALERAPAPAPAPALPSPAPAATDPVSSTRGLTLALAGWGVIGGGLFLLFLAQRRRAMRGIGPRRPVVEPRLLQLLSDLRRQAGVRRPVRLTQAAGLTSPVALGWNEIVLPEAVLTELDGSQQKCLLAHELAHLVRRDPFWLALGCSLERLLFFQPLNRLARIRLQEAAEYLCDDWAVHRTGSGVSLATCLVKVAEWVTTPPQPVPLAGMAERRSQLVIRIHRLIEGRPMPSSPRSLWFAAGLVSLVGLTAVAAPSVTAHAQQPVAQDTLAADTADTTRSSFRRMLREMRLLEWRARSDVRRAAIAPRPARPPRTPEAMAFAEAPPAPMPALAPWPTPAPALAPMARADAMRDLARARVGLSAELAAMRGDLWSGDQRRQRDTTNIAVPALIGALKDPDVEVRRAAAQSLANLEDPRAVPALIAALGDADTEVRGAAASGLAALEDPRAVPALVGLLKDKSPEVRYHALAALANFPDGVPADAILAALEDSNADIRQVAMSLATSRVSHDEDDATPADPRFVAAFTRLLKDGSPDVRQAAVSGLGELRLTKAPPELLALVTDKSEDVRQQLAYSLGEIGDPKGVPALKTLLTDASGEVREAAVHGLSEIRDQSALEALVGALRSNDATVRRAAAMVLGQRGED